MLILHLFLAHACATSLYLLCYYYGLRIPHSLFVSCYATITKQGFSQVSLLDYYGMEGQTLFTKKIFLDLACADLNLLLAHACARTLSLLCYYYSSRILPCQFDRLLRYGNNQTLFTKNTFLVPASAHFNLLLAHACARSLSLLCYYYSSRILPCQFDRLLWY